MFDIKDEYIVATENARINQHSKVNSHGYKLGILNLFLLTTIGVMGYVGFDSLSNNSTKESLEVKNNTHLLEILNNIDIEENKNKLNLLATEIDNIIDNTSLKESKYSEDISMELKESKKPL